MYRRIARNSMVLGAGTAAASLMMMLSVAIAARSLGAHDFGVLVLLQSAVQMLRALAGFGTQQPVIKLGSDAQVADDRRRLGEVISMGLAVDVITAVATFGIAAFFIEISRKTIGLADQDVGSAWMLAVSLLFAGYPASNGIFRLYDRFGLLSLIQTLSAVGLVAGYAVLYAIAPTLQAFVAVWAVYFGLSSVIQLWISLELLRRDHVPLRFRWNMFSNADGRTLLHYCWSTWGTSTADTIRTNGDSLLVGAIVSVEAAGIYNVARQLAGIIRKLNVVYMSTVFPEIARLGSRKDVDGARKLNRRMLWLGLLVAIASVGLALIFGKFIVQLLFGARFGSAYLPFVILTAAAVAQLISITPSMCVQVYRGPRLLLLLIVVATLVFAVTAVPLTYLFSISGTAVAQLIFGVALILLCNWSLRDLGGQNLRQPDPGLPASQQVMEK
jgi:O-antigen/teichoic acid export membrane protein